MKAATSVDVWSALLKAVDAEVLADSITIYKERGKPFCLIKPKKVLLYPVWLQIQREVKKLGGKWTRKQHLWEVPLNG